MDPNGRVERGRELLRAMLGPERVERTRQAWRELCTDFEAYVVEFLSGEVWSRPGLDLRTKSLVTVATLTALGRPLALELNLGMALNNGATRQDLDETLLQIAPYAGFPACWEGLALAQKVFRDLDAGPRATEDDSPRDDTEAPGPDPAT
jgi:4-carboxymuconolactone decarboxylase